MGPTEEDFARDLARDMALCEAASPGPWEWVDEEAGSFEGQPVRRYAVEDGEGGIVCESPFFRWDARVEAHLVDVDMIAACREGWPCALRLAMHYRAEAARLEQELAEWRAGAALGLARRKAPPEGRERPACPSCGGREAERDGARFVCLDCRSEWPGEE